jgi:hypothetical protein
MSEGITREQDIELENNIGNLMLLASLITYIRNKITITIPPGKKRT